MKKGIQSNMDNVTEAIKYYLTERKWVPQQSNKEEPMKPDRYFFNKYLFKCRQCGKVLDILEHTYCPGCGQKIDWSEYPADEPETR